MPMALWRNLVLYALGTDLLSGGNALTTPGIFHLNYIL